MIDFSQPFFGALVTTEGTFCLLLRWGSTDRLSEFRFFYHQFLDEEENPIIQPYPTPQAWLDLGGEDPLAGFWVIDLQDLPPVLTLVAFPLALETWQEEWNRLTVDRTQKEWSFIENQPVARPGHELWASGRCFPTGARTDVEISHLVRGGAPAYRMRESSAKTEEDFPDLPFTLVPRYRRRPPRAAERQRAAAHHGAWINQLTQGGQR